MAIYSLDILLSQFGTSPLFHVQFCCFLTCIYTSQEADKVAQSWKIDGGKMETVAEFIFLGSKITVDRDYSH